MIVNKLRLLRESKNYSQQYIASQLGLAQNTYSKIETGASKLSLEVAQKLSQIYNVSVPDIISPDAAVIHFSNGHNNIEYIKAEYFHELSKDLFEEALQAKRDEISSLKNEIEQLRYQNSILLAKLK